jgi:signal transduction histidine kinase
MAEGAQHGSAAAPTGERLPVARDLATAYASETARLVRQRLDLSVLLFALFMGVVVVFERRIPGHQGVLWAYVAELAFCILGIVSTRVPRLVPHTNAIAALTASALAVSMLVYSAYVHSPADPVAIGQVCVMTCLAVVLPWGWRAQVVVAGTSLAGFVMVLPLLEARSPILFALVGVLTGATVSCAAAFFLDRFRFEAFVRAAELSRAYALQQEEAEISRALLHVGQTLSQFIGRAELLERVNRLVIETLGCDFSSTFVYDEERDVFRFVGNVGSPSEIRTELEQIDFPPDSMPIFASLRRGELVELPDASQQDLVPPELLLRFGVASLLCVPIYRNEHFLGLIGSGYRERTGPFSRKQRRTALGIAHAVVVGLDNERLIRDLRAANRLKSDFVATMSHELRTPLNVILGYAEMLSEERLDGEREVAHLAHRIRRSASTLLELVNATLDLGRMESGRDVVHLEPVAIAPLLAEAEAEFEPLAHGAGLAVRWRNEVGDAFVLTDRVKLKTILKNLVGNAIKYTPHGSVTVTASRGRGEVVLSVRDTGVGIAPEDCSAIFEMFRQIDGSATRAFGGVGLGLYIVRQLVDRLRGSVEVESAPGVGSTFTVRLPERPEAVAGVEHLSVPAPEEPLGGEPRPT